MKKIDYAIIGLCFLAVWATDSRAAEWSEADTARQVVATFMLYADYKQTKYIFAHPLEYHELNPLIHSERVEGYFALSALAAALVAVHSPGWARPYVQNTLIAVQTVVTARNSARGVMAGHSVFVGYTHAF